MGTKPTHHAYLVIDPPEGSDRKARWIDLGTVWPASKGGGFDVVIPEGMFVTGRIVCVPPKES